MSESILLDPIWFDFKQNIHKITENNGGMYLTIVPIQEDDILALGAHELE